MERLAELIEDLGIGDQRLVDAFRRINRRDFVPNSVTDQAFEDRPLPIPHGQVTTQPSLTARMIAALDVAPGDRVLEIGTGHGFQTALLAALADRVVSIERFEDLAETARSNLEGAGIDNVEVRVGDGSKGAPDEAPYDAILVSAAYPQVPEPLAEQLKEGGRLVQPIGPGGREDVTLFVKGEGRLEARAVVVPAHFVPLVPERSTKPGLERQAPVRRKTGTRSNARRLPVPGHISGLSHIQLFRDVLSDYIAHRQLLTPEPARIGDDAGTEQDQVAPGRRDQEPNWYRVEAESDQRT